HCTGSPCDPCGQDLLPSVPPLPFEPYAQGDWMPFTSQVQFELAEFLYKSVQMSAGKTDTLMDILASLYDHQDPPFVLHDELYKSIDAIPYGDCPWQSFSVKYSGPLPKDPLSWMLADYDVWYQDPPSLLEQQFGNPEFADSIDYTAKVNENGQCEVCDLMSGQWAWDQSELIAQDPDTHGATFAPIILGSDKTTVSIGTGNMEYYPLYISLGNVHNCVHHSHGSALSILAFLSILKSKCPSGGMHCNVICCTPQWQGGPA
ncbi:hypothetical protein F5J12DRAFT_725092, partial [Pisolithus orientalis]|uniref:uncharacterized protein n=1 Tax=Pisolithus orientalis TaxID=936130 RepID=UPI002225AF11